MTQPKWMLTEEEIGSAKSDKLRYPYDKYSVGECVAKAQAHKLIEWLFKPCPHREEPLADVPMAYGNRVVLLRYYRHNCPECMGQLKREVEGEK